MNPNPQPPMGAVPTSVQLAEVELSPVLDLTLNTLDPGILHAPDTRTQGWLALWGRMDPHVYPLLRRFHQVHPQAAYLAQELFTHLLAGVTERESPREPSLIQELSQAVMALLDGAQFRKRCAQTQGSPFLSILTWKALCNTLLEAVLPPTDSPPDPPQGQPPQEGPAQSHLPDFSLPEPQDSDDPQDPSDAPDPRGGMTQEQEDRIRKWIEDHSPKQGTGPKTRAKAREASQTLRKGMEEGTQAEAEAEDGMGKLWGRGAMTPQMGELSHEELRDRMALLQSLARQPTAMKLVQIMGKMRWSLHAHRRPVQIPDPVAVGGSCLTGHLPDLQPHALALLASPQTRALAVLNLLNDSAQGFERQQDAPAEAGGVCLMVDCSGSMGCDSASSRRWSQGGPPMSQVLEAAAMAGVIAHQALLQGRPVHIGAFNDNVKPLWQHGKERFTPSRGMDLVKTLLRLRAAGGTRIDHALSAFLELPASFRRCSDFVLVSDGIDRIDPELLKRVAETTDMVYVRIGGLQNAPPDAIYEQAALTVDGIDGLLTAGAFVLSKGRRRKKGPDTDATRKGAP